MFIKQTPRVFDAVFDFGSGLVRRDHPNARLQRASRRARVKRSRMGRRMSRAADLGALLPAGVPEVTDAFSISQRSH